MKKNITELITRAAVVPRELRYIEKQIMRTQNKIDKIDRAMEALNEDERLIIKSRYIDGLQWWQVAGIVKYSERWCREKRKEDINKLALGLFGDTSLLVPSNLHIS